MYIHTYPRLLLRRCVFPPDTGIIEVRLIVPLRAITS